MRWGRQSTYLQRSCGDWLFSSLLQSIPVVLHSLIQAAQSLMESTITILATSYWAQAVPGFPHNPTWYTVMWSIWKMSKPRLESWSNMPDVTQLARDKAEILTQVYTNPQPQSLLCRHLTKLKSSCFPQQEVCTSILQVTVSTFYFLFHQQQTAKKCVAAHKVSL